MKKNLISLLVLASPHVFFQEIKGTVRDHSSLKFVPYASVYYNNTEIGTYTDSAGNFNIQKRVGDTLIISALGFEKFLIPINDKISTLNISLVPLTIDLNEVVVTGKKFSGKKKNKVLRLGNLSSKEDIHISGIKGRTVAYLVKNDAKITGRIKSIQYSINPKFSQVNDALVKVHLYTVNTNTGQPGLDLLRNAKLVKVSKVDKSLVVNLDDLDIELPPTGVFIGLEWVDFSPWYTLSKSTKPTTVYMKFMDKDWQLRAAVKGQSSSSKKVKNKAQQVYFEEPNFNITVIK